MKDPRKLVPAKKQAVPADVVTDAVMSVVPGAHVVIDGKHLRIIDIGRDDIVTLVEMDTRSLRLYSNNYHHLLDCVEEGSVQVIRDPAPVFDRGLMSESEKADFDRKKEVLARVAEEFGPKYFSFRDARAKQF